MFRKTRKHFNSKQQTKTDVMTLDPLKVCNHYLDYTSSVEDPVFCVEQISMVWRTVSSLILSGLVRRPTARLVDI